MPGTVAWKGNAAMKHLLIVAVCVFCAHAADSLHVFRAGDTARASLVNDNFKYLLQQIETNSARLQALNDSLDRKRGLPVGTIVASMLNPQDFSSSLGPDSVQWRLADGSNAPASYIMEAKKNLLPDL
jgi:hypothetical protein